MSNRMKMNSMERVAAVLNFKEPDQIPLFLMLTCYGARELDMTIRNYYSKAEHIVKAQLRMREKYRHDCLYAFMYSAIEVEAFGGEIVYSQEGSPNAGEPFLRNKQDIRKLLPPSIENTDCLMKGIDVIQSLRIAAGDGVPVLGVVISPFSLPIMQMGFGRYIELIYEEPELFNHLMRVNQAFCTSWANAQLAAGATAIAFVDAMASPLLLPTELYRKTGYEVDKKTLREINGMTAIGFGSAPCGGIMNEVLELGTHAVVAGAQEDIGDVKSKAEGQLAVMGNLNYLEVICWERDQVEKKIKSIIRDAGKRSGLIITDSAGEVPYAMPEERLFEISECVREWGKYPLDWID